MIYPIEQKNIEIEKKKMFYYKDGKLYFNREAERMVYFILMLVMACSGILIKLGLL
jgi:hypothetical protein